MNEPDDTEIAANSANRRKRFALALGFIFGSALAAGYLIGEPGYDQNVLDSSAKKSAMLYEATTKDLPEDLVTTANQTTIVRSLPDMRKDRTSFGSGVFVAENIAITNAHVVGSIDTTQVIVYCRTKPVVGTVIWNDALHDIAVIQATCPAAHLNVDESALDVNDALLIIGYDFDFEDGRMVITKFGKATSPIPGATVDVSNDENAEPALLWQQREAARRHLAPSSIHFGLSNFIQHGNSGSPVMRLDGSIVGLAEIADLGHGRSFMIPASSIARALRDSHAIK